MKELFTMLTDPRFHLVSNVRERFGQGPEPTFVRLNREGFAIDEGIKKKTLVHPYMHLATHPFAGKGDLFAPMYGEITDITERSVFVKHVEPTEEMKAACEAVPETDILACEERGEALVPVLKALGLNTKSLGQECETLIVNCQNPDPGVTWAEPMLLTHTRTLSAGLTMLRRLSRAQRIILAVPEELKVKVHDFEVVVRVADGTDLVVRDDGAVKAPLTAEDLGHAGIVLDVVDDTDAVEAGHDAAGTALDHCILEGLHVDLTHGLLVSPRRDVVAVGFLIVQEVMFAVRIDASRGNAGQHCAGGAARKHAVLAVVLEVTSGERAAVRVHRRSVPAVVAVPHTLFTDEEALLMRELLVPGGRDHLRRAPVTGTGGSARGDVTVLRLTADRARAVCVDSFFLTDAVDALRLKETNGVERLELFVRKLVHEQLPRLCSGLAVDRRVVALYDRFRIIRAVTHEFGETDGDIAGLILCLRPGIGNIPQSFSSPQLVDIVVLAEHEAPFELVVDLLQGHGPGQIPASLAHGGVHLRGPVVDAKKVIQEGQFPVAALRYPFFTSLMVQARKPHSRSISRLRSSISPGSSRLLTASAGVGAL